MISSEASKGKNRMNGQFLVVVIFILLSTACSEENDVSKQSKSQNLAQEKANSVFQPQMNALKKAKALEGQLKKIEENRLKTIEGFED